jgi:virginiamycin A acetyltransferase
MNGANHRIDTFSSFPFAIFGSPWSERLEGEAIGAPSKGDTRVCHDVWIGYHATMMPGVTIGNGSIIAAKSIVVSDVPPYSIYGGNPARLIRPRFNEETVQFLEEIQWWNWDYSFITEHLTAIFSTDIAALRLAYQRILQLR